MQHSEDGNLLLLLGNICNLGICSVCNFILTAAVIKLWLWFIMRQVVSMGVSSYCQRQRRIPGLLSCPGIVNILS